MAQPFVQLAGATKSGRMRLYMFAPTLATQKTPSAVVRIIGVAPKTR
jgi:hypothetical protein